MPTMEEQLQAVADGTDFYPQVAIRYLDIYLGECTASGGWMDQLAKAFKKFPGNDHHKKRNFVAYAILAGAEPHSNVGPVPEDFFHKAAYFRQLTEHDWFARFQKIVAEDMEITKRRAEVQSLGRIEPIEYQPYTRQAYNWLYEKAEETGVITPETKEKVSRLLKNLVYAYGGVVICGVFQNHPEQIKKVANWRTGYFFEKVLHKVYSSEQILRMKKTELNKTSAQLVKRVRND